MGYVDPVDESGIGGQWAEMSRTSRIRYVYLEGTGALSGLIKGEIPAEATWDSLCSNATKKGVTERGTCMQVGLGVGTSPDEVSWASILAERP